MAALYRCLARGAAAAALAASIACGGASSAGAKTGESWTFPLVDPLEDGLLVTSVTIAGHGPYLFAFDPNSNITSVDAQLVADAQLKAGKGPRRLDEAGTQQERIYTQLPGLTVGNRVLGPRPAMVVPASLYDTGGRHLSGVLGRDVIEDQMVFGWSRDQGVAMMVPEIKPPDDAIEIPYHEVGLAEQDLDVTPEPRHVARAAVNGTLYSLHLDFGGLASQLRASHWATAELTAATAKAVLIDDAASVRTIDATGTAKTVTVGGFTRFNIVFVPYIDERWDTGGVVDGTLGLDFFAPFTVWINWQKTTCYLTTRADPTAAMISARLARWGSAIPACPHPGCVTAAVATGDPATSPAPVDGSAAPADGSASAPATDSATPTSAAGTQGSATSPFVITIQRDAEAAQHALQVVLAPKPRAGLPTPGWLVVNLTAGADQASQQVGPAYQGATFDVIDVSPFPRSCPDNATSCITAFALPTAAPAGPAAPPADSDATTAGQTAPAAPARPLPNIASDKLHRRTGELAIAPGDAARAQLASLGGPPAVAIIRICLDPDGKIASDKLVKTSKVAAYDQQLLDDIKRTWTFDPAIIAGHPSPACASFTFKLPQQ